MKTEFQKPEYIFVPGIGKVYDGQIVEIPVHRVVRFGGVELSECTSREGECYFLGGYPHFGAVVVCKNANELDVPIQCLKMWTSDGENSGGLEGN